MREESQIEDMRAAIRGDRERAEQARQRSTENVRTLGKLPAEDPEPEQKPAPSLIRRLFRR